MTLSTNVYVLDPIDAREVFEFCQPLVNPTGRAGIRTYDTATGAPGIRRMGNELGQGLDAILDVTYCPDGPVCVDADTHADWCGEDCTGKFHEPVHCVGVDFDTSYGYKVGNEGCGHLHARYIATIGAWLDAKGIHWAWRNEFTGEVHDGDDRYAYARLPDLAGGGADATAWFTNTVMPAIMAGSAS